MYKFINTSNKKLVDISIIKLSDLKKIKHYLVELKKIFS